MASRIVEFFGFSPEDKSERAQTARDQKQCPFIGIECQKTLSGQLYIRSMYTTAENKKLASDLLSVQIVFI